MIPISDVSRLCCSQCLSQEATRPHLGQSWAERSKHQKQLWAFWAPGSSDGFMQSFDETVMITLGSNLSNLTWSHLGGTWVELGGEASRWLPQIENWEFSGAHRVERVVYSVSAIEPSVFAHGVFYREVCQRLRNNCSAEWIVCSRDMKEAKALQGWEWNISFVGALHLLLSWHGQSFLPRTSSYLVKTLKLLFPASRRPGDSWSILLRLIGFPHWLSALLQWILLNIYFAQQRNINTIIARQIFGCRGFWSLCIEVTPAASTIAWWVISKTISWWIFKSFSSTDSTSSSYSVSR